MTANKHFAKRERQIATIRKLVKEGNRLGVETRKDMRALNAAQKRTEASLKAVTDSLRAFTRKRKVDLP